jgi:hypothetical protein
MMSQKNMAFFLLNLVGGIAILGGYWVGLEAHSGEGDKLWGDIPESVRPMYTACMFPAAAGYLVSFGYLVRADWDQLRFETRPAWSLLFGLHILFLSSASLWMPMTWAALDGGLSWLLWPIQGLLAVTGLSCTAIAVSYRRLIDPPRPRWARVSFGGLFFLIFQCLILDAIVWPRFFEIGPG